MDRLLPIDAVVTWVDGDDPAEKAKRAQFAKPEEKNNDDIGGEIRYTSVGEINYCIASIFRFAPWIRKVFIVTDSQDPKLGEFVEKYFPGRSSDIEIVDHKVLFAGYEDVLPVFNSLSIESVLWRIPGLSERFVYFNDDVMLVSPVWPSDLFTEDGVVCYAYRGPLWFAKLQRWIKHRKGGHKVFGFKDAMVNAADLLGVRDHFIHFDHTPHQQRRDILENYFNSHQEALRANISHRFRDPSQFNPQELCYLIAEREGRISLRPIKGNSLYVMYRGKYKYIERKVAKFRRNPKAKFCCVNSIGYACAADRKLIFDWLKERLDIE